MHGHSLLMGKSGLKRIKSGLEKTAPAVRLQLLENFTSHTSRFEHNFHFLKDIFLFLHLISSSCCGLTLLWEGVLWGPVCV